MKNLFSAFIQSFSIYSTIPMPKTNWKSDSNRYVLYFFPLVGLLIGFISLCWLAVAQDNFSGIFYAAVAAAIPVIISGGIHIDGYIDTCDALASHGDFEKKKAVLQDSHTGAFGVIYTVIYFLLLFAAFTQFFYNDIYIALLFTFFLSRVSGSALVLVTPSASRSGMLYNVTENKNQYPFAIVLILYTLLATTVIAIYSYAFLAILIVVIMLVSLIIFRAFAIRNFGGLSGDIAGFYIAIMELIYIMTAVIFMVLK